MTYGFAWLKQIEDEQLRAKLEKMAKELEQHGFKTETEKQLEQLLSEEEFRSEQLQMKTDTLTTFLETLAKLDKEELEKFQTLLIKVEFRRQVAQDLLVSVAKINTEEIYEQIRKEIFDNLYVVVEPSGKRYCTLKGRENEIRWEIRRKKRQGKATKKRIKRGEKAYAKKRL